MILRIFSQLGLVLFLQSEVWAQEPERRGEEKTRPSKRPTGPDFGKFLKQHDLDKDGRVSPAEFASGTRAGQLSEEARGKIFDRLDKNDDGFIAADELETKHHGRGNPFLKKADTNGDGRISREEFLANPPFQKVARERLNRMFDRMDQNDDGFLDAKDRRAGRNRGRPPQGHRIPRFNPRDLDTDENGGVSWKEFLKAPFSKDLPEKEARRAFDRLDGDADGEITPKEVRSHFAKAASKPPRDPKRQRPVPGRGPRK